MASVTDSSETLFAGSEAPIAAPVARTAGLWRWSVEKYHEMVRSGIIDEDDPVELLDGYAVGDNIPLVVDGQVAAEIPVGKILP